MPNWCTNTLTVTGLEADIAKFREQGKPAADDPAVSRSHLSLNKLYPLPEGEPDGGYAWCIEHWGTKWDVEATLDSEYEDYLEYLFESAWSPPVAWLKKVSQDFPTLRFRLRYDEPGEGFMGIAVGQNGDIKDQTLVYY